MRKWGVVISAFYALILLVLLLPVFLLLAQSQYYGLPQFLRDLAEAYGAWEAWAVFAVLFSGQALLLFLSVDTTQRRLQPRTHIFLTCVVASILIAVLTFAVIGAIGVAVQGDEFGEGSFANPYIFFGALWVVWGVLFYLYFRNSSEIIDHMVSWLLKGSILEHACCRTVPRYCASASRLLGTGRHKFRDRYRRCHHANFFRAERAAPVQEAPRDLCASVINLALKQKRRSHLREAPFSTPSIRAD